MADAHVPADNAEAGGDAVAFAGERNFGLAAGFGEDFDVGPGDAAAPASAEDFEHRFFGGESAGEVFDVALGVSRGVLLLFFGIDAVEESLRVLVDELGDAVGFDDVDAMSNDGHGRENSRLATEVTEFTEKKFDI
jgi:hypothetical protein